MRFLLALSLFTFAMVACMATLPPPVPPLPPPAPTASVLVVDAGVAEATVEASAPVATTAPSAAAAPPAYHVGDYRLMLPTGRTVVPTIDGGSYAVVDGNERPCDYGCTAAYASVGQTVYQRFGKPLSEVSPGDYAAYLHDYEACTKSCKVADHVYWPGSR
jgi:hypothetical protein